MSEETDVKVDFCTDDGVAELRIRTRLDSAAVDRILGMLSRSLGPWPDPLVEQLRELHLHGVEADRKREKTRDRRFILNSGPRA